MDIAIYLNALTGFFVIIDPIGTALVFHSITPEEETKHRRKMAFKSIIISAILLIVFGNHGESFLNQLGIDINSLRIAGGLLLFYTAFNMITKKVEYSISAHTRDISVFPLTIPLLAGPGALTLSILMYSNSSQISESIAVTAAIVSILLFTLLLMLLSKYLKNIIRKTGDEVLRRFLGVILAALAIQFVYDGIANISV
jgi:multiple antibiotic resistance protein